MKPDIEMARDLVLDVPEPPTTYRWVLTDREADAYVLEVRSYPSCPSWKGRYVAKVFPPSGFNYTSDLEEAERFDERRLAYEAIYVRQLHDTMPKATFRVRGVARRPETWETILLHDLPPGHLGYHQTAGFYLGVSGKSLRRDLPGGIYLGTSDGRRTFVGRGILPTDSVVDLGPARISLAPGGTDG